MKELLITSSPLLTVLIMGAYWAYVKIRTAVSPRYRLKRQQAETDAIAKRKVKREATAARNAKEELEWALSHPDKPAARRLLEEKLADQTKLIESAEESISSWGPLVDNEYADTDRAKANLAEAKARKADAEKLSGTIRSALGTAA